MKTRLCLPTFFPDNWREVRGIGSLRVFMENSGLKAIGDIALKPDGRLWLHISFSREDRLPSYRDLIKVKELFFEGLVAIQIFPKPENHVNIHPNCLHLWACEDQGLIPEMSFGTGSI